MPPRPDRTTDALSTASKLLRSYRGQGRAKSWGDFAEGEGLPEPVPARRWHGSKRPDARGSSSIVLSRRRVGVIVLGVALAVAVVMLARHLRGPTATVERLSG